MNRPAARRGRPRGAAGSRWRALLLVVISTVGIVLTVRAERASEARANRLHRGDQLDEAATIYVQRLVADSSEERLHYNLGTTLLRLGNPSAQGQLLAATLADEERVRVPASYNLGLWELIQALFAATDDSVRVHAAAAIEANKAALRLDPEHVDAQWNLAMAQSVLDAATPRTDQGALDQPNGAPNLGEIQIIEGPQPFGDDQSFGDSPSESEDEARAFDDLEPLSPDEAEQIIGTGHLDPTTIVGKLLTRESRARRRQGVFVEGPPW